MIEYLFGASAILILVRAILGPSFADRVISVDVLTNMVVLFMVFYSIKIGNEMYLDVALLFALISFVGVLAIAKWARR